MNNDKFDDIVSDLLSLMPLFQKKLLKTNPEQDHNNRFNHTQFRVMMLLREIGMCPISEVSKKLFISMPNMSKILNKLIDENMVSRTHDDKDRRVINISLTNDGHNYLDQKFDIVKNSIKMRLSNLSEEQIIALASSLSSLKNVLSDIKIDD